MPLSDRRQVLADFREGRVGVLVSCEVLTEGYDERSIGCVVMARPTKSLAFYQQAVGRGLRIYPEGGKRDCLVLDILDRCSRHRVVKASDLFGVVVADCGGMDVREAVAAERIRHQQFPLSVSPAQQARWELGEETRWSKVRDLTRYRPLGGWHTDPATERQLKSLRRFGFDIHRELSKREASHLLDLCHRLDAQYPTPATAGQEDLLRRCRLWRPGLSKREAIRLIAGMSSAAIPTMK
jgi:hypothetical protein